MTWARDATSARTALLDRDSDVAVLDVMLPEGQDAGFELVAALRDTGFRVAASWRPISEDAVSRGMVTHAD